MDNSIQARPVDRTGLIGPVLTGGFFSAVVLWITWFVTHLPWLQVPEHISLPVLLATWLIALTFAAGRAAAAAGRNTTLIGVLVGLTSAVPILPLLGTKTSELANASDPSVVNVRPDAWMIALGFVAAGAALGLIGGLVRSVLPRSTVEQRDWLPHFALVAIASIAPLLFVGGLVTSTSSGMAVPDWPNTFGSNMFLYPLGPRAAAPIYLEHSHRLFGTLAGFTTLVLMIGVLTSRRTSWEKALVVGIFSLVCVQGILGGTRVNLDSRVTAMIHGVLAQLIFGLLAALATYMSAGYAHAHSVTSPSSRKFRILATAALHTTIFQLIMGAIYRHFRHVHVLYTHIALSLVVLIAGTAAGFVALAIASERAGDTSRLLRNLGRATVVVVFLQFLLGWAAFLAAGSGPSAGTPWEALIRTAHQANGALFLLLVAANFVLARRLAKPVGV